MSKNRCHLGAQLLDVCVHELVALKTAALKGHADTNTVALALEAFPHNHAGFWPFCSLRPWGDSNFLAARICSIWLLMHVISSVISALSAKMAKKSVAFVVHLITKDSKSAEKLNKAIKKGVEMMSMLGAMEKEKSKEDKLFMKLVNKIKYKKKGASVQIGINIPKSLAIEVAKEFAK